MDNTPPPSSGGQSNQPPDNTPESAETERIIIEPSSTPDYTPPAGQPYSGQPQYTGQPEYTPSQPNYPPAQPTVPMSGPPPSYQPPPQQYVPPQSTPQYQQPYQQPQYQQPYPQQGQPVVAPKKGGMPGWAMVLIGLFVAILLMCGLLYWFVIRVVDEGTKAITSAGDQIGATFTAASFDIALSSNSYESAHDLLGGDLANRYSVSDLQEKWEALSADGFVSTDMSDVKMSGGRPQIVWSLTPSGGTKKDVTLTFQQSGDDWKFIEASPDLIPSP